MQGGRQLSVGMSLPRPCIRRQQKIRPISGDNGLMVLNVGRMNDDLNSKSQRVDPEVSWDPYCSCPRRSPKDRARISLRSRIATYGW